MNHEPNHMLLTLKMCITAYHKQTLYVLIVTLVSRKFNIDKYILNSQMIVYDSIGWIVYFTTITLKKS